MKLVKIFKSLFAKASPSDATEPRSIVIMQRAAHRYSEKELQAAGERGWEKKFDGNEDPMYFILANHPVLTVLKAGPHIIRVASVPTKYADDDEYALSQLPQPEQKQAWKEHRAYVVLDFFNDLSDTSGPKISDAEAYASLAKLTLQLGDANCTAIFIPVRNIMMPNDGSAEQGLRLLINKELPMKRR